jgi:hypothetical protein
MGPAIGLSDKGRERTGLGGSGWQRADDHKWESIGNEFLGHLPSDAGSQLEEGGIEPIDGNRDSLCTRLQGPCDKVDRVRRTEWSSRAIDDQHRGIRRAGDVHDKSVVDHSPPS